MSRDRYAANKHTLFGNTERNDDRQTELLMRSFFKDSEENKNICDKMAMRLGANASQYANYSILIQNQVAAMNNTLKARVEEKKETTVSKTQ